MVANIEKQTGMSLPQWVDAVGQKTAEDSDTPVGFNDIVDWLKQAHGFGHFQARLIATEFRRSRTEPDTRA